jgi:hypothetical protein
LRTVPVYPAAMRRTLLLAALAVLVLAGCRFETNIRLELNEDGSGSYAFEFGMDEEFRELMSSQGADLGDLTAELPDIPGGEAYEREAGEMTFEGYRIEFDDANAIDDLVASGGDEFGDFTSFMVDVTEDSASFDATLSAQAPQDFDDLGVDPTAFAGDFFSASFILTMPGTVTDHNADEVLSDGSLRWDLPIFGGDATYHAESTFGGSGFPWLPLIIGLAILLGAAALIVAVVMGRRQEKQAVSDAAASYPEQVPVADAPTLKERIAELEAQLEEAEAGEGAEGGEGDDA